MENLNVIPGFNELFQKCHPEMVPSPSSLPQQANVANAAGGTGFPFVKVVIGAAALLLIIWAVQKLKAVNEEHIQNWHTS